MPRLQPDALETLTAIHAWTSEGRLRYGGLGLDDAATMYTPIIGTISAAPTYLLAADLRHIKRLPAVLRELETHGLIRVERDCRTRALLGSWPLSNGGPGLLVVRADDGPPDTSCPLFEVEVREPKDTSLPALTIVNVSIHVSDDGLTDGDVCALTSAGLEFFTQADDGKAAPPNRPPVQGTMLSCPDLAKNHGVDIAALDQRLRTWRKNNDHGWKEAANRKKGEPRYIYTEATIMHIINDLRKCRA